MDKTMEASTSVLKLSDKPFKMKTNTCGICLKSENKPLRYGDFVGSFDTNITVHYLCLITGTYIPRNGSSTSDDGIDGFRFRDIVNSYGEYRDKKCFYCRQPSAAVECAQPMCDRRFHYICGCDNSCLTQFVGQRLSYCHVHIPAEFREIVNTKDRDCDICYNELPMPTEQHFNPLAIIRTHCNSLCPKGLMHRECVQKSAFNAGSSFNCPLCFSGVFRTHAAERGIFIPARQPTWRRGAQALKDPTQAKCTAVPCTLANTQEGTDAAELVGCKICGAQLMHKVCSGMTRGKVHFCDSCRKNDEN